MPPANRVFPPGTILIRNTVQQKEFELNGLPMVDMFAKRGATQEQWLANRNFRTPDILFDNEAKLDLGGVTNLVRRRPHEGR
jgi:hypothetical protein